MLVNSGHNFANSQTLEDFTFSGELDAPVELSWVLSTFEINDWLDPEEYIWELTVSHTVSLDDVFKIVFLDDPDNLNLTHYDELFTTTELWGHFYLNTDDLGVDASAIDFADLQPPIDEFPVRLIYPLTLQIGGSEIGMFDYLYDQLKPNEGSVAGGKYKLTNNAEAFAVELSAKLNINLGFGSIKTEIESRVIYNKQWGILSTYYHHIKYDYGTEVNEIELLFEITDATLKVEVAYEWVSGLFVLFIAGVVILRRKKRI